MHSRKFDMYGSLMCSFPAYKTGEGNGCMMIYRDKREWVAISQKTCLCHWAQYFCTSIDTVKEEEGYYLRRKKYLPIVMDQGCTLIPIKVRHPKFKDDGAYGYVKNECVSYVDMVGKHAVIHFVNGDEQELLMTKERFEDYQREGEAMNIILCK